MKASEIEDACRALVIQGAAPPLDRIQELVRAYYAIEGNEAGGSLHIVLDDGNKDRESVEFCVGYARENGDAAGEWLARAILLLSDSQLDWL